MKLSQRGMFPSHKSQLSALPGSMKQFTVAMAVGWSQSGMSNFRAEVAVRKPLNGSVVLSSKTAALFSAADPIGVDLDQSLYALDSTTIDLCLSLFPWAKFRRHKAAVKMHTLLDLHG